MTGGSVNPPAKPEDPSGAVGVGLGDLVALDESEGLEPT